MKIPITFLNITPSHLGFEFCFFGEPLSGVQEWINYWKFNTYKSGSYTNIKTPEDINFQEIFHAPDKYDFFDGFSPNLNKHLHLGHLSNLILAKALQKMDIGHKTIAILGDTLDGAVQKDIALAKYKEYLKKYDYHIDEIYFASEQKLKENILVDGEGDYEGCKIFEVGDEKIVGIKSTGTTSYFYQDVALHQHLNFSPTLYLTGIEQNNHFDLLKKLYPNTSHRGLGLILLDGKKMSSSEGNVIFMEDILNEIKKKFSGDDNLAWNVLCGQILKYGMDRTKDIKMSQITDVKLSQGLYISYTMARMFSAGIEKSNNSDFHSKKLNYLLLKSKYSVQPNILFEGVVNLCKEINTLYATHQIRDNEENKKIFQTLVDDLIVGANKLGLFLIDKV
jgi:arginyl-tRNA synthetase